ncbi:endonuclease/exonuclease/phosphatase family protein [Azospirillum halopraeferens]|uniref:endonuclease/exonuclease/phosphatase family protein n=1 Tax=Azospirillum halopraeferens TaxID=34010 RepID=UPI0003FD73F0|nr:endonuclease/exonuclease/phosphatase family protein [Azospirillum halopraeferens]
MIRVSRERVLQLAAALRAARIRRRSRPPEGRQEAVPEGMASFAAATWNIHSCVGLDARFAPDRIAEVIRGLDADLVGLQEVGWHHRGEAGLDQFEYLSRATGLTAYPAPTKHNARAHYGNCILTRLPVRSVAPIDLRVPHREPRGGIDMVVEVEGRPVRVVVAHLGLDPWERAKQVARVLTLIERDPDLPALFMGDLNEWAPNSARLRRLDQFFDDGASPRSFHARMPTLRLDRIYVRGGLRLPAFEVVRTTMTRRASDHLPVRAVVAVP